MHTATFLFACVMLSYLQEGSICLSRNKIEVKLKCILYSQIDVHVMNINYDPQLKIWLDI